jgi:hypothetical protein
MATDFALAARLKALSDTLHVSPFSISAFNRAISMDGGRDVSDRAPRLLLELDVRAATIGHRFSLRVSN